MERSRTAGKLRRGKAGACGRLRAYRREDMQTQVERRLMFMRPAETRVGPSESERQLARRIGAALRRERQAAHTGLGYDALRHLVLARLMRTLRRRRAS